MQAQKLDMEWKAFYTAIEDRTNVINLSTSFHEKIEQVSDYWLMFYFSTAPVIKPWQVYPAKKS